MSVSAQQASEGRRARSAAVVTVAGLYGAGSSSVSRKLAERLQLPFLERALPADTRPAETPRPLPERLLARLARVADPTTATGLPVERVDLETRRLRTETERFLATAAREGGVVLGRGAAVVLRTLPGALHVLLQGEEEARVGRVMELESLDRSAALRLVRAHDRARREYVLDAYGVDADDPSFYHVTLDTFAFSLDACVELIVAASDVRRSTSVEAAARC